jgi:hypothetical protein
MPAITFFSLLLFLCSTAHRADHVLGFTRSDFPWDFVFGAATSAYQVGVIQISFASVSLFLFLEHILARENALGPAFHLNKINKQVLGSTRSYREA